MQMALRLFQSIPLFHPVTALRNQQDPRTALQPSAAIRLPADMTTLKRMQAHT